MGMPWPAMVTASLGAGYLLNWQRGDGSKLLVLKTAAGVYAVLFLVWAFCKVILYPKFLSRLRDLPEPKNPSWWNGQYLKIHSQTTGGPMREW